MKTEPLTKNQLAAMLDHTYLKADATEEQMKKLCDEAKELGCAMVAINPFWTYFCKNRLLDCDVHVGAAIGFPLGQISIAAKVAESEEAIMDGADEIDYVVNISMVKMADWIYIKKEMRDMVAVCREHDVICKVIFENCYLTKDEIRQLALIAKEIKPDYIKTSTGFGTSGATVEDVALMKETVGDAVKVKAAGGIRDLKTALAMIEAGAERIGTSASVKILQEMTL